MNGSSIFAIESIEEMDSLELSMKRLALESIDSLSVVDVFKSIIPKSVELIKSFIPGISKGDKTISGISEGDKKRVMKALASQNFLAYEELLIYVPEGFKGKLLPYMTLLASQQKELATQVRKALAEYNSELAQFLSNKDSRRSLRNLTDQYRTLRRLREDDMRSIEAFYDKKNPTLSRRRLGTVLDRFSDFQELYRLEQTLAANRDSKQYTEIAQEVQRACEMLKLIHTRLEAGDIADMSRQVAQNLSEGAYEMARYVEFAALHNYYVENAMASVKNTTEVIRTLFKA